MKRFQVSIPVQSYFMYDVAANTEAEAIAFVENMFADSEQCQIDYDFNNTGKANIIHTYEED